MSFPPDTSDSPQPALPPPQFTLRALLWAVTIVCVLLATMKYVGPAWALAISLLLLLIGTHMLGNALGVRLRDGATPRYGTSPRHGRLVADEATSTPAGRLRRWQPPPSSRLQQKQVLGWMTWALGLLGAVAGGAMGGGAIASLYWDRIRYPALALAIVASAIIGATVAFIASTFGGTLHRAWRDALDDPASHARQESRR